MKQCPVFGRCRTGVSVPQHSNLLHSEPGIPNGTVAWLPGMLWLGSASNLKPSPLFLSSVCGSLGPSFFPSSLLLLSTSTANCCSLCTLVSLLKKNTIITAPCGSCTNICCFDSTLFQHSALEGLCERFLQAASWWESCGTMKTCESPI